jgi:hypothetical protein
MLAKLPFLPNIKITVRGLFLSQLAGDEPPVFFDRIPKPKTISKFRSAIKDRIPHFGKKEASIAEGRRSLKIHRELFPVFSSTRINNRSAG